VYNCKRSGLGCKNGGKCVNGACVCTDEYTGYNCGVQTGITYSLDIFHYCISEF